MSEYTLYIDDIEHSEHRNFDSARLTLLENIGKGTKFEIYKTYHIAESGKKYKSERMYKCFDEEGAKKRFQDYWIAHSSYKENLESEIKRIEDLISTNRNQTKQQICKLKYELTKARSSSNIEEFDSSISRIKNKIDSLGFFRRKEKLSLNEQLEDLLKKKKAAQLTLNSKENDLLSQIRALEEDLQKQVSKYNKRIWEIRTELTKPR